MLLLPYVRFQFVNIGKSYGDLFDLDNFKKLSTVQFFVCHRIINFEHFDRKSQVSWGDFKCVIFYIITNCVRFNRKCYRAIKTLK